MVLTATQLEQGVNESYLQFLGAQIAANVLFQMLLARYHQPAVNASLHRSLLNISGAVEIHCNSIRTEKEVFESQQGGFS